MEPEYARVTQYAFEISVHDLVVFYLPIPSLATPRASRGRARLAFVHIGWTLEPEHPLLLISKAQRLPSEAALLDTIVSSHGVIGAWKIAPVLLGPHEGYTSGLSAFMVVESEEGSALSSRTSPYHGVTLSIFGCGRARRFRRDQVHRDLSRKTLSLCAD